MLLVLASLSPATPKTHSASWLCRQRATESDVRSLVGCHLKETLHRCQVTLVFSNACSDQTHTGHHLLCPLRTTMLAKSQSQSEPPSQKADRLYQSSLLLRPLIRIASGKKGGRNTEAATRAWCEELQKLRLFFMQWSVRMRTITDDAMAFLFGLRLLF